MAQISIIPNCSNIATLPSTPKPTVLKLKAESDKQKKKETEKDDVQMSFSNSCMNLPK